MYRDVHTVAPHVVTQPVLPVVINGARQFFLNGMYDAVGRHNNAACYRRREDSSKKSSEQTSDPVFLFVSNDNQWMLGPEPTGEPFE